MIALLRSPRARWSVLLALLAATLLAANWVDGRSGESVPAPAAGEPAAASAKPARAGPAPGAGALAIDLERLQRPPSSEAAGDLFAVASWAPQAIAAAQERQRAQEQVVAPPPAPVAPPLPFTFLGRMIDGEVRTVFLTRGERTLIAAEGETIEGDYRVERVAEHAVTFTFLPLKQQQTLTIPGAPR
jgi:hypothetical protein